MNSQEVIRSPRNEPYSLNLEGVPFRKDTPRHVKVRGLLSFPLDDHFVFFFFLRGR